MFAIDPHTGLLEHHEKGIKIWTFEEFKNNIKSAQLDDIVIPIVKTSEEAASTFDKPVEFIFIDGLHEYEYVKLDFDLWFPKLVNGGIIAFHDTILMDGPKKVVKDAILKTKHFKNVRFVDHTTIMQKVECNNLIDRIRNRYVLLLKTFHEIAYKLPLPEPMRKTCKKIIQILQF